MPVSLCQQALLIRFQLCRIDDEGAAGATVSVMFCEMYVASPH